MTSNPVSEECVLCSAKSSPADEKVYVLFRGSHCFVMLNLFPYNNGHLMIVPHDHVSTLNKLDEAALREVFELASKCEKILTKAYSPQGFNIGMNIGKCAGAGIQEHIHLHIIPRWHGDTNFMSVVAETRVIPEDIEATYKKLKPLF